MKSLRQKFSIRHFRNEKGTGAEMCPTIVSGIVSGDAPVNYWPFVRQTWHCYYLRVLSWCYLKGKWSLPKSYFFQNYCHAWHTRLAVFVPFPSCCVSSLPSTNTRGLCELGPVSSRFVSVEWYLNWSPKIRELFSMQRNSSSGSKRLINYCIHTPNWLTQDPL